LRYSKIYVYSLFTYYLKAGYMAQSVTKIWIHAVWATKDLQNLITPRIERRLFAFMTSEFNDLGCHTRIINGTTNHVHCIFLLNAQKSLSEVIKHVKGGSSHYVNYHNLIPEKFAWNKGYLALAVSDANLSKVLAAVKNQNAFHLLYSFQEEINDLLVEHHLDSFYVK